MPTEAMQVGSQEAAFIDQAPDILLVFMPFGPLEWPSPALGQLVAGCRKHGLSAEATYPAMGFARQMGMPTYNTLSGLIYTDSLIQEWLFAEAAFGERTPPGHSLIDELFPDSSSIQRVQDFVNDMPPETRKKYDADLELFLDADGNFSSKRFFDLRKLATEFTRRTAAAIVEKRPAVVGCTTTFLQYNASIGLLREIRRLAPDIVTVLGGGQCEGTMGPVTIEQCPWVDYVVSGEADTTFPTLCQDIIHNGQSVGELPVGVLAGQNTKLDQDLPGKVVPALLDSMDGLPMPAYDSYYRELKTYGIDLPFEPPIVMECSRGCWKGMRQHCAFCGLQGERMAYRAKNPEKVLAEMRTLSERYNSRSFLMTDSILNNSYFSTLLEQLTEEPQPYSIFYEIISTLGEEKVRKLARAGILHVQPGIESLNDHLLKCLNKGNRTINSIAFLKFCEEQGMRVVWNILYQIPGEEDADYEAMNELVPLIRHLPPPRTTRVRFDRFSDYHNRQDVYDIQLKPLHRYKYVYPFDDETLNRFALFFQSDGGFRSGQEISPAQWRVIRSTDRWRRQYPGYEADALKPRLELQDLDDGRMIITDTRDCSNREQHELSSLQAAVYRACRAPTRLDHLVKNSGFDQDEVQEILDDLKSRSLLLNIGQHYLALATDAAITKEARAYRAERHRVYESRLDLDHEDNQVWKIFSNQTAVSNSPENLR